MARIKKNKSLFLPLTGGGENASFSRNDWFYSTSRLGGSGRRSKRRRRRLSRIKEIFDKNPRLETAVGFFYFPAASQQIESYESYY
jgi:hypothetical protein